MKRSKILLSVNLSILLFAVYGNIVSLALNGGTVISSHSWGGCIDCAIVGAGPAGLATSIAISKSSPSSSIAIFERDDFQPKGASIQISRRGWKTIAELDSADGLLTRKLDETSVPVKSVESKSWKEEGKEASLEKPSRLKAFLSKTKVKLFNLFASRIITRVHLWHDIRVALWEYAVEQYTAGTKYPQPLVHLNLNLEDIQVLSPSESNDGARFILSFSNAVSKETLKVRAKNIVACDGVKSKVRSILPNEPNVLLAEEKSVWRGLAPNISTSGKATFFRGARDTNTSGRSGLIFPGGKNAGTSWTVISDVEDQRSESHEESKRRVMKVIESMGKGSDNFNLFKDVIDDSSIVIENKLFVRDFDKPWKSSYDGIIYIGDSAHPVRPTGEGTALALEDAKVLGQVIVKHGFCDEALREYENERYEPVKKISEKVRSQAENFYKEAGWSRKDLEPV
mmetsp:Transcript_13681/g.20828  ORF Transcript_13681/g.20828 Transcript_13681/m.20828 type:complete len:455 (-) Transcript_13681:178-1542(-)|eukprot:CAMPEP_0178916460 /NCGR_PEP_ID=MMETSP0786-20121207/12656_1 /TAXON_ID=186022 /ORGANISM="Thalassionema frauenfeldii, Strain CCMP 1798" /LENGTH=454 /DNA_ID=CAMNT_0020589807 /DNA_START=20 /DNA_END=1384 /DNA_ORIENTATION=-